MREKRTDNTQKAELIQACIANVRCALGDGTVEYEPKPPVQDGHRVDGCMSFHGPWGNKKFVIEAHRVVTAQTAKPLMAHLLERQPTPLLLTEYVNPEVATLLCEQGIHYVDAAGNMFIKAMPLFIRQQGFKRQMPTQRPERHLQVAGLKLLSFLLWEPTAVNATYRELGKQAQVSLGAMVPVFADLAKDGFLRATKQGRQLIRLRELLEQWALGYAGQLFPRIFLQTCRLVTKRTVENLAETVRRRKRDQVLLGGEAAAGLMTGYLRPGRAAIHLSPLVAMGWMAEARLVPDPQGNVDLVVRFGDGNQWAEPPAMVGEVPIANPVLIYGELLRLGQDARLRETANRIFEQFIAPKFGAGI